MTSPEPLRVFPLKGDHTDGPAKPVPWCAADATRAFDTVYQGFGR